MANKNKTYITRPVYNRKIARNMLKHAYKTNKIHDIWHDINGYGPRHVLRGAGV